ncbi:tripartite motif-containing protein 3-like [Branchiostoma floridae]|uniref:RING-type E3 ubiquitin transferase n=1 Tax=Branchiostoma floridae TaxID=7739 RepID=A0A9J7MEB5_BRAFL|nr:tripartite motif-containing protein 3-like [Branchiostoma floridae]
MAATPSSLGEQICEELSCSICLELFTRPKVLPCQHTFCQDCLQDITGRKLYVKCPNCRRQVRLPNQGVAGLPDCHIVANMCDKLQQQSTLVPREERQSGNRCSFHPCEVPKLYCNQCNKPVCTECLDEVHNSHNTITLKKALRERKEPVQELITEGRNILETYVSFLKNLKEKEKTLDRQKQETDNSIIQAYNQEVQKVAEKKDHLLFQEEEKYKKKKEAVQKERNRMLADVSELSAACDRAEKRLKKGGLEFLSQETILTEVVGKYRGKPAPVPVSPVQILPTVFQPTNTLAMGTVAGILLLAVLLYSPLYGLHHGLYNKTASISTVSTATSGPLLGQVIVQSFPETVTFGGEGSGTGQFIYPCGVVVSDEGEIFVADRGNQRIQVFTLQGTFVRQFPTVMSGRQKMIPHDIARDGEGNLWVVGNTESAECAVQYNKQGRVLRMFDLQKSWRYRGVAVDTRRNHILITQTTSDEVNEDNSDGDNEESTEVLVFRPDGTLVRTVGQQQGMGYPGHVAVDGEGNIFVSDWYSYCVFMYNKDGQFLFRFGAEKNDNGHLWHPRGICTDRAGNVILADTLNHRVVMFDQTGRGLMRNESTDMWPWGVAVGPQGQLVVTDFVKGAVHIIHSY